MRHIHSALLLTALLAALLGACDDGDTDASGAGGSPDPGGATDQTLADTLQATWGVRLLNYTGWEENYTDLGGGEWSTSYTGETEIEGLGTRRMAIEHYVEPIAAGTHISLLITDVESDELRSFEYNAGEGYVNFGNIDHIVSVAAFPDGSYSVWTISDGDGMVREEVKTLPDGYAALREIEAHVAFKDVPPHMLMTAYALAQAPTVAERGSPFEVTSGEIKSGMAAPVCAIFKEFCDCAACLALDRFGACAACPEL